MSAAASAAPAARRCWTPEDDALLRKFHAEGKDDASVAYIINRNAKVVHRHRKALGLKPNGIPGPVKGTYKLTGAIKAKIRAFQIRRWREDGLFAKAAMDALDRGRETNTAKRWRMPTDPTERGIYIKIRRLMGAKFAKKAIREITSTTASPAE